MNVNPPNQLPLPIPAKWHKALLAVTAVSGLLCLLGALVAPRQFGFSWLTAFMFYLSLVMGALFLVMIQHLCAAQWMVPLRRMWEHLACLVPVLGLLFVPILLNVLLTGKGSAVYSWTNGLASQAGLSPGKQIFLQPLTFAIITLFLFGLWTVLAHGLRRQSLRQDQTGSDTCRKAMRLWSAAGMVIYAFTITVASALWMQSVEPQFISTIYGVYYFSGSVWAGLAFTWLLVLVHRRTGALLKVTGTSTYHDLGVMLLAFTLFYAYIHYSQYFLIWNAAIPEETFWYVKREQGSWSYVGLLLVVGHFFVPFLILLKEELRRSNRVMVALCLWAGLMHYLDMMFNIQPALNSTGFRIHWLDVAALAFMGGFLGLVFLRSFAKCPAYPLRDPQLLVVEVEAITTDNLVEVGK